MTAKTASQQPPKRALHTALITKRTTPESLTRPWAILMRLNGYRLLVGLITGLPLLTTDAGGGSDALIPAQYHSLYLITVLIYLGISTLAWFTLFRRRLALLGQIWGYLLADLLVMTALLLTTSGISSGFGMLLIVPIATSSLLLSRRQAQLAAILAIAALLCAEALHLSRDSWGTHSMLELAFLGLHGLIYYATAILANFIYDRLQKSEALAQTRAVDLASLNELNEFALQQLDTGILVVDEIGQISLANAPAERQLGLGSLHQHSVQELPAALTELLQDWQQQPDQRLRSCRVADGVELLASFKAIGSRLSSGLVITLQDASELRDHAQQDKLAALGRLTASIAHEIRNPLSAIQQASQLLDETQTADSADARLTAMIQKHVKRVDNIIDNVLQLSRKPAASRAPIHLHDWLAGFVRELHEELATDCDIQLNVGKDTVVLADESHLHQVLWNLCRNAARYGQPTEGPLRIAISTIAARHDGRIRLQVSDNGKGIANTELEQIFEPFFSANYQSTGLGLFIARQLLECNNGHLSAHNLAEGGAAFRLELDQAAQ